MTIAPTQLAVQAEDLRKSFRGRPAVNGLDLAVPVGEVFGLVGPDGAGKTTTFRLLCGILTPDSGRMSVAGHDVTGDPEAVKARIGYLSQVFSQYPFPMANGRIAPRSCCAQAG
jgi:ABC-2 type transport system ATP-binding protein